MSGNLMKLLIIGPPGSGKGTQSQRIALAFGMPHISTGELLRDAIRLGTPLGNDACECIAAGHLVPDALVNGLVRIRLDEPDIHSRGFLLDGFPRNIEQLDALLAWLRPDGLDAVIELAVPNEVVVERLAARGRTDDTAAGIRERLRAFARETLPMLHQLETRGLMISIDANRPIDDVAGDILDALMVRAREVAWSDAPVEYAGRV
jgi:adenylate kinase